MQLRTPGAGGAWTTLGQFSALRFHKEVNQVWSLDGTGWNLSATEKTLLVQGNDVRVMEDTNERWYGQIRSVYDDPYTNSRDFHGNAKTIKAQDRAWATRRTRTIPIAADVIVNEILFSNEGEPKNGQVLYWDMETLTPDGKLLDLSTGGNNSVNTKAAKSSDTTGKLGIAAKQTINQAAQQVLNATNLQLSTFSHATWFKVENVNITTTGPILIWRSLQQSGANFFAYNLSIEGITNGLTGMSLKLTVGDGTATQKTASSNPFSLTSGVFVHFVVTVSGTSVTFYKDGTAIGTSTLGGSVATITGGTTDLQWQQIGAGTTCDTTFDEFYVYNRVLLSDEIARLRLLNGGIFDGGLLADSFDPTIVDLTPTDRLSLVDLVAKAINGEWWSDRDGSDNDRFRFTKPTSGAPVMTLQLNVSIGSLEQKLDREVVRNDIVYLGSGDGVNQLQGRTFHATTIRTTLTALYTAGATGSIPVTDSTAFPTSGIVFLGQERVLYSGKDATHLGTTSVTRAYAGDQQTSYAAYDHQSGLEVYLHGDTTTTPTTYYRQTSAQSGSSIATNGWRQAQVTDRGIRAQDTLDRAAQRILSQYKDPRESVQTMVPSFTVGVTVGDMVTVLNADGTAYQNSPYRAIVVDFDWTDPAFTLDLANPRDLRDAELTILGEQVYRAEGSTQGYVPLTDAGIATFTSGTGKSRTTDPTTLDIAVGTYQIWKNTTSGAVKLWYNDGGTLKSVALA